MLRSLHIENIAVIKDAEIEFHRGFTALTGETGAGKSMIIDGLDLLMGGRASKELIRTGAERASVVAMFTDIDGNIFRYAVVEKEVLKDTAIKEMTAGEWDLTLFTCTVGGASRMTVRCERLK